MVWTSATIRFVSGHSLSQGNRMPLVIDYAAAAQQSQEISQTPTAENRRRWSSSW